MIYVIIISNYRLLFNICSIIIYKKKMYVYVYNCFKFLFNIIYHTLSKVWNIMLLYVTMEKKKYILHTFRSFKALKFHWLCIINHRRKPRMAGHRATSILNWRCFSFSTSFTWWCALGRRSFLLKRLKDIFK